MTLSVFFEAIMLIFLEQQGIMTNYLYTREMSYIKNTFWVEFHR